MTTPQSFSFFTIRLFKINDEFQTSQKGGINVSAQVGRQHRQSLESLEASQQIRRFQIRVAIVRIRNFRALPEECVRFVKKEHCLCTLGRIENSGKVLLRLADPLRNDARQ